MKKVIIFDCGPSLEEVSLEFGQSPEWIISALKDQSCEFDWIKAYAGQTIENSSGDAWIITGSPRSVYEEEDWMLRLEVTIRDAAKQKIPILGICLGSQLLARAFGASTYKLKFGHRGGNHPVRDLATGKFSMTAQNHGYAVDANSLPSELEVSHVNLNDGTVEGFVHTKLPAMGIQFHSEASPGPLDNTYLFDRFLSMVKEVM